MGKIKQLITNILKLENLIYLIQAKIAPNRCKVFSKKKLCSECWDEGICVECGCDIEEMFSSSKPCPKGRFGSEDEALIIRILMYIALITAIFALIL